MALQALRAIPHGHTALEGAPVSGTSPAMERELEQTVRFLRGYIARHGYSPSVRDVVTGLRLSSTSVAKYRLKLLEQRGVIRSEPGHSRTIRLTTEKDVTI
jgi:SOS-response transcriptional repressor LexA